jgi:peptidase E
MFVLISHKMTEQQCSDAQKSLNVKRFHILPTDKWSQVPAEMEDIDPHLSELKRNIESKAQKADLLFVQGDYGATFNMVQFAKEIGLVPVYATSVRRAYDVMEGERVVTVREFQHVRFRKY